MRRPTLTQTGAGLVALVAGYASFRHIVHVAQEAGEVDTVAYVLPLAVDGLILAATAAMADDKRDGRRPRLAARVALVAGIGATLATNVASAHPAFISRAVAAWPALAFLLAVEVLARRGKLLPDERPAGKQLPAVELPGEELPADVPVRRRFKRGELADEVARLVAELPAGELPERPADRASRLAELTGGSARHIERILPTLNGKVTA